MTDLSRAVFRPVKNHRLGQWHICHDQWCRRGETNIVATILSSLDDVADEYAARLICQRLNAGSSSFHVEG